MKSTLCTVVIIIDFPIYLQRITSTTSSFYAHISKPSSLFPWLNRLQNTHPWYPGFYQKFFPIGIGFKRAGLLYSCAPPRSYSDTLCSSRYSRGYYLPVRWPLRNTWRLRQWALSASSVTSGCQLQQSLTSFQSLSVYSISIVPIPYLILFFSF